VIGFIAIAIACWVKRFPPELNEGLDHKDMTDPTLAL
jgi:hypothetical protein